MENLRSFLMEDWLENNRFSAKFNLGESGARARKVEEILNGSDVLSSQVLGKFLNIKLNDSPNWGRLDLREKVAQLHPNATANNVLITTGTSEALFLLFHALKPKKVALALPGFQLLYEVPESFGAQIIPLPIYWDTNGKPFINEDLWLDVLKQNKPDCILINNPHNPSGLIFSAQFIIEIKKLSRNLNATLIGDEHYRFLASTEKTMGETLYDGDKNIFITGSFIKCIGTPGLRIGWCVGNEKVLSQMQNEKNYTTHTVSPIIEWIAYEVIKNISSPLFHEVRNEWKQNKKLLQSFLTETKSIYGTPPEGGLVTSLGFRFARDLDHSESLIQELFKLGVFVLPLNTMEFGNFEFQKKVFCNARVYSKINQGFGFRLGLGIESGKFFEALGIISEVLEAGVRI